MSSIVLKSLFFFLPFSSLTLASQQVTFNQERDIEVARDEVKKLFPDYKIYFSTSTAKYAISPISTTILTILVLGKDVSQDFITNKVKYSKLNKIINDTFTNTSISNYTIRFIQGEELRHSKQVAAIGIDNPAFLKSRNSEIVIGPFAYDAKVHLWKWKDEDVAFVRELINTNGIENYYDGECDDYICARTTMTENNFLNLLERKTFGKYTIIDTKVYDSSYTVYTYCGSNGSSWDISVNKYKASVLEIRINPKVPCIPPKEKS